MCVCVCVCVYVFVCVYVCACACACVCIFRLLAVVLFPGCCCVIYDSSFLIFQFWFAPFNMFSGQIIFERWTIGLYNVVS